MGGGACAALKINEYARTTNALHPRDALSQRPPPGGDHRRDDVLSVRECAHAAAAARGPGGVPDGAHRGVRPALLLLREPLAGWAQALSHGVLGDAGVPMNEGAALADH